jgi:hypothetical protein
MSNENNEKTYSLAEAAAKCGMSLNKFRAHKDELVVHGSTVSSSGWTIPESALSKMGWLGVKPEKKVEKLVKASLLAAANKENNILRARVLELEEQLAEATTKKKLFPRFR